MAEQDQCIVCLEDLVTRQVADDDPGESAATASDVSTDPAGTGGSSCGKEQHHHKAVALSATGASSTDGKDNGDVNNDNTHVAEIDACGHALHDNCLRAWCEKANSCPICRKIFHKVTVRDGLRGKKLSSYRVKNKKQSAEFDIHQWMYENPDDQVTVCNICDAVGDESILLLCDGCDGAYHTHCVDLDDVPEGQWYCSRPECQEIAGLHNSQIGFVDDDDDEELPRPRRRNNPSRRARTQTSHRRDRQRLRDDIWEGTWGQVAGSIFEATGIDLDYHEDDDDELAEFARARRGRSRQLALRYREAEQRDVQRWRQRIDIASRLGVGEAFQSLPRTVGSSAGNSRTRRRTPPAPQRDPVIDRAWSALDRARNSADGPDGTSSNRERKRRSRSSTVEEAPEQPQRPLKRPRTRRVGPNAEPSHAQSSNSPAASSSNQAEPPTTASSASTPRPTTLTRDAPSFLSSLLREVETGDTSGDEDPTRNGRVWRYPPADHASPSTEVGSGSPLSSPPQSVHNSPRLMSSTPPPSHPPGRPCSPLSLSTHVDAVYPPARYQLSMQDADRHHSDRRGRPGPVRDRSPDAQGLAASSMVHRAASPRATELRHPQPTRPAVQTANPVSASSPITPSGESSAAQDHNSGALAATSSPSLPSKVGTGNGTTPGPTTANVSREVGLSKHLKEAVTDIVRGALRPHWHSNKLTAEQYSNINKDVSHLLYGRVDDAVAGLDDDAREKLGGIAKGEVARAIAELKA